ncbi:MAG: carbohydrate kinase family protein [Oscillospiraceae bacterium]
MRLTALPCLCADVFDESGEIRTGGEAMNFAVHAAKFEEIEVALIGIIGKDCFGEAILETLSDKKIEKHIRVDEQLATANNRIYLTSSGDRYFKEDSWNGEILDNFTLNDDETKLISESDAVFVHFWASCFREIVELKKKFGFKLAVDFDVYRDFADMEKYAPFIEFFMISGAEDLLHYFREFSEKYGGLFNMSLGENGSVTYFNGKEYRVKAKHVERVVDTTGCGDSYHAGFVCSYLIDGDIEKAMRVGSELAAETLGHFGGF